MSKHVFRKIWELIQLTLHGHGRSAVQAITSRLRPSAIAIGLRRDLAVTFTCPAAKIPIDIRPLLPNDDLSFLSEDAGPPEEILTRLGQRWLLSIGLQTCYVATAPNGDICYMQWLMSEAANAALARHFETRYPRLCSQEALLEGAYTVPAYRGLGIMASAMARIAEQAREFGARWVITFVDENNIPSLKGCERAGFLPYIGRRESRRLFRREFNSVPLQSIAASRPETYAS